MTPTAYAITVTDRDGIRHQFTRFRANLFDAANDGELERQGFTIDSASPCDDPRTPDPTRPLIDEMQAQYTAANMARIQAERRSHGRRKSDDERARMQATIDELVEAAIVVVGWDNHLAGCDFVIFDVSRYACNCGFDNLRAAIKRAKGE